MIRFILLENLLDSLPVCAPRGRHRLELSPELSCPLSPQGTDLSQPGLCCSSAPWGGRDSISWVTAGPALLLQGVPWAGGLPAPPCHGKDVFGPHSGLRARCRAQSTTARGLMEPGWLKAPYAPGWGNK